MHTGREFQRSLLPCLAQSRLSCGVRPGCTGHYFMGAGNAPRKGQHHTAEPIPTDGCSPILWNKSFPLSPAFLALLNLLPTKAQDLPRTAHNPHWHCCQGSASLGQSHTPICSISRAVFETCNLNIAVLGHMDGVNTLSWFLFRYTRCYQPV